MSPETNFPVDTAWVFKQFIFEDVLRELDDHFQQLKIDYMPIKGAYLICSGLAKQIKSRTMSDIDILVRERDFDAVVSHFRSIQNVTIAEGSWPVNKKGWPFEVTVYFSFKGGVVTLDFHKLINFRERFLLEPETLFDRGVKQGRRTFPSAEDALIICLCHGLSHAGHFYSDALFEDVPLLKQASIDWKKFWYIARSTRVEAFMYYVLKKFEKKGRILPFPDPKKTMRFVYAEILLALGGNNDLHRFSSVLRRLLIELPFCRDPFGLVLNKFMKS